MVLSLCSFILDKNKGHLLVLGKETYLYGDTAGRKDVLVVNMV